MTDGRTLAGAIEHWVRAAERSGDARPRAVVVTAELPVGSDLPPQEPCNNLHWSGPGPDEALSGSQG